MSKFNVIKPARKTSADVESAKNFENIAIGLKAVDANDHHEDEPEIQ